MESGRVGMKAKSIRAGYGGCSIGALPHVLYAVRADALKCITIWETFGVALGSLFGQALPSIAGVRFV